MNLRQLVYFKTVSKYNSFSKAAEELLLPHQTISHAIKALENEYDTEFFFRTAKGVSLTPNGHFFLDICNQILELDSITRAQFSGQNTIEKGSIRAISNFLFSEHLLTKTLIEFENKYSEIKLEIQTATELEIIASIANNEYDIGFFNNAKINNNDILKIPDNCFFYPLMEGKYCIRVGHNSPLKNYKSISIMEALKYQFIFYEDKFSPDDMNTIAYQLLTYYGCPDIISCTSRKMYTEKLMNKSEIVSLGIINVAPKLNDMIIDIPLRENISTNFGYILNYNCMNPLINKLLDLLNI